VVGECGTFIAWATARNASTELVVTAETAGQQGDEMPWPVRQPGQTCRGRR
jgi:hypothetical protein